MVLSSLLKRLRNGVKVRISSGYIQRHRPSDGKTGSKCFCREIQGTVRQELYNRFGRLHMFDKFAHVRELIESWQKDYNENRPHKGLKYKTPLEYVQLSKVEILLETRGRPQKRNPGDVAQWKILHFLYP